MAVPQEEFLYLACLHEGTGVDAPDFIAVVDAEEGRVVHELPMPNAGDELPDRSPLIVPGFRSSRIHVVNVADDPRRTSVACRSRSHSRRSHRPPASSRWSSARG